MANFRAFCFLPRYSKTFGGFRPVARFLRGTEAFRFAALHTMLRPVVSLCQQLRERWNEVSLMQEMQESSTIDGSVSAATTQWLPTVPSDADYLFVSARGACLTSDQIRSRVARVISKVFGIDINFRELRQVCNYIYACFYFLLSIFPFIYTGGIHDL